MKRSPFPAFRSPSGGEQIIVKPLEKQHYLSSTAIMKAYINKEMSPMLTLEARPGEISQKISHPKQNIKCTLIEQEKSSLLFVLETLIAL